MRLDLSNDMKIREINREVFVAEDPVVNVGNQEIDFLKMRVGNTERKRIRLCAHKDVGDRLHEMFIVLSKETYIRPHKHLNKAESLHVIDGSADAVFFDEAGNITKVMPLSDYSSGKPFYYRIGEPLYHTLCIRSEFLIFHEATQGPFQRSDTVFAPWSPAEDDSDGRSEFIRKLSDTVYNLSEKVL